MSDARTMTAEELDMLAGIDSPTVANALERLRLRDRSTGYVGGRVRCAFPDLGVMVGRALTVTVSNALGRDPDQDGYWELWSRLEQMDGPVVVVMQDASGTPTRVAFAGEVMATLAMRLGAVGIVTDGALRDVDELRAMGLHCFSRHTVVSHASFELSDVGGPVHLDGETIRTGDILHGDANGIVVVPREALADLQGAVFEIREAERRDLDYILGPDFTLDGYRAMRGYGVPAPGRA